MREYNRVSPRFWTEAQVEGWSDAEKLLGLYLLTCEARTTEGLYRLTWQTVSGDLDWSLERVTQTVSKLLARGFVAYDETARVVLLPKALSYQRPENANQIKAAVKSILALPRTELLPAFVSAANQHCPELVTALSEPLRNRYPNGFETLPVTGSDSPTPTPAPTPDSPIVPSPSLGQLEKEFEVWWVTYGRVGTKADAAALYRWWRTEREAGAEELLTAATNYRRYCLDRGQYQQHARTFLAKPSQSKDARWPEWARGEEHNTSDTAGAGLLEDVLEAGALGFGLTTEEQHDSDTEGPLAISPGAARSEAVGQASRRILPAVGVDRGD